MSAMSTTSVKNTPKHIGSRGVGDSCDIDSGVGSDGASLGADKPAAGVAKVKGNTRVPGRRVAVIHVPVPEQVGNSCGPHACVNVYKGLGVQPPNVDVKTIDVDSRWLEAHLRSDMRTVFILESLTLLQEN